MAKGGIAQLMTPGWANMFSMSSIIFAMWQHAPQSCACWGAFGTPILEEGRSWGRGQRWYHSKERCWTHMGSPLWPLRYFTLGQNLGRKTFTETANLNAIRKKHEDLVFKIISFDFYSSYKLQELQKHDFTYLSHNTCVCHRSNSQRPYAIWVSTDFVY